jgi:hypothetical protein
VSDHWRLLFLSNIFKNVLGCLITTSPSFATSIMSSANPNQFSGHIRALLAKQPGEKPLQEDIDDDIDGEKETIPTLTVDDLRQLDEVDQSDQNPGPFAAMWRASITSASKGVTDKTDSEYQRSVHLTDLITLIDVVSLLGLQNNVQPS